MLKTTSLLSRSTISSSPPPPPPAPKTYLIRITNLPLSNAVDEGLTVEFEVNTTNVEDGTSLYWTLSSLSTADSSDFVESNGSFTVSSGVGIFSVQVVSDLTLEGLELFSIDVREDSVSGSIVATSDSITINDTSVPPSPSPNGMVLIFDTTRGSNTVDLPLQGGVDVTVDWGDGETETFLQDSQVSLASIPVHTYSTAGVYTVTVTGAVDVLGYVNGFNPTGDNKNTLIAINSFGDLGIQLIHKLLYQSQALETITNVLPSTVNMLTSVFEDSNFNLDISGWNTSNVTHMQRLFYNAKQFNQPIGNWDTGSVVNMTEMFGADFGDHQFNQPIGNWDTGSVTTMARMFSVGYYSGMPGSHAFNQPIGNWNTSSVTTMEGMFYQASSFNQNIGAWVTSNVIDMASMFSKCSAFNQPIGSWDVSKVLTMSSMFYEASSFNQPIGSWNVSGVLNMASMFGRASSFNQAIGSWNTGQVEFFTWMFYQASSFNQPIGSWDVRSIPSRNDMTGMFMGATSFNQNLSTWCVTKIFSEPSFFATNGCPLLPQYKPVWGTCPA